MSVLTLTPSLLKSASHQLAQRVVASGFQPCVVVGILNGGAQVARLMLDALPAEAHYCEVSISRPSTQHKRQSFAQRLLRHMPLWLCDVLRVVESRVGEWRSRGESLERVGNIELPPDVEETMRQTSPCQVLVIDDAIDSGATIQKVREQLVARFPAVQLRVAVITVTTPHPLCEADFCLYHDRTLCRFPWSNDYRRVAPHS